MSSWYEQVPNQTPLTQGDIVTKCPVVTWTKPAEVVLDGDHFEAETGVVQHDVVVLSQACDLEQNKITEVIVCPIYPLTEWRPRWAEAQTAKDQLHTDKIWAKYLATVKSGTLWNLSMLNMCDDPKTEHCIVNFHSVYATPRSVVEKVLTARSGSRLRLRAPYREHLSQAFARFFMRVGLPVDIEL